MKVASLTSEGMISIGSNSPKLMTLHLCAHTIHYMDGTMAKFNAKLKKLFHYRKLITGGHYMVKNERYGKVLDTLYEQDTDLVPLWNPSYFVMYGHCITSCHLYA